jgi:hypothetical protein
MLSWLEILRMRKFIYILANNNHLKNKHSETPIKNKCWKSTMAQTNLAHSSLSVDK